MSISWRWGAAAAVLMSLSTAARGADGEQVPGGIACVPSTPSYPTCESTGTCLQPYCSSGDNRFLATEQVVLDHQNGGRLWQRDFGPRGDYATAQAYCAELVLEGITGWRLPTNPEIGTIVLRPAGLGGPGEYCVPSLDQAAFRYPDPEGTLFFWTSSGQGPPRGDIRYTRDFSNGRSPRTFEDDLDIQVRCVHDPL